MNTSCATRRAAITTGRRGARSNVRISRVETVGSSGASMYLDVVKVYRLVDGRYPRAAELTRAAHDVLTTPLMPGLTLPLADIFPEP